MNDMAADGDPRARGERSSLDDIIDLYKKDVDRALLREALKLTPEQRLDRLYELVRSAEELREAGERAGF